MRSTFTAIVVIGALLPGIAVLAQGSPKHPSALYPPEVVARVQANVADGQWASNVRKRVVAAAEPWRTMEDKALWDLMFGATLSRAWMVWSDGHSPITGEPVPMYNWKMNAMGHPWKVQDPSSGEWFPKNDFKAYHDSGLDTRGVFDESKADRSLLFNAEHPDPDDPLHRFGVDDGHGYVNDKGERWRFIAAYLIYGQWKQAVLGGIGKLSAAYVVTGDTTYAHKAAVMLDRVADLYPTFDFKPQGIMYEGPGTAGYVSTWHDACEETRELALAYDMIFPALEQDSTLVTFLAGQAKRYGLENAKTSVGDIQRNIEDRILRDALAHPKKIHSNYPRAEICQAVITRVLQEPDKALWSILDPMLEKATAVDGVTGEKGLANYSAFTIQSLAQFLAEFAKADPAFLPAVLERQPQLHDTYRFHIDTLCLGRYYPLSGDTGSYAFPLDRYVGMNFLKPGGGSWPLTPSTYRFLWELYEATGDVAFAQTLYRENGNTLTGLPHDIFGGAPMEFQEKLGAVIEREGTKIVLGSVNKKDWHLAILRSGKGKNRRALWLDYDTGGAHSHQDGMNLGLFAHGLDVLPEMGYPAVQFGGWAAPKGRWYGMTAAHNTVLVDRKSQPKGVGKTTLWLAEAPVQAIRASGAAMNNGHRYERTAVLVDIDASHFFVIDVFRVEGGTSHTKFVQSHFGALEIDGLKLADAPDFGHKTQTRNFMLDPKATSGWQGRWAFKDQYELISDDRARGLAYTDLSTNTMAGRSEAWVNTGGYDSTTEQWIPRLVVERKTESAPLASTFVSIYEPYIGKTPVLSATRLPITTPGSDVARDTDVALQIRYPDGGYAIVVLPDPATPGTRVASLPGKRTVECDGDLALLRFDPTGQVIYAGLAGGTLVKTGDFVLQSANNQPYISTQN
jgi:oligo-alginate lyase